MHTPPITHLILESALERMRPDSRGRAVRDDVSIEFVQSADGLEVWLEAKATPVRGLHLRWPASGPPGALYLSDAWGRSEFELAWRTLEPERFLPWYFLWHHDGKTGGFGVRTDARSFACFNADPEGLSLYLDTRNGGSGVLLGGRRGAVARGPRVRRAAGRRDPAKDRPHDLRLQQLVLRVWRH